MEKIELQIRHTSRTELFPGFAKRKVYLQVGKLPTALAAGSLKLPDIVKLASENRIRGESLFPAVPIVPEVGFTTSEPQFSCKACLNPPRN